MTKIIAFEGVPGAGKTTLIRKIIEKNLLKKCINIPQLEISQQLCDLKNDLEVSMLYLDAEGQKFNKITNLLRKYDYILLDRTFLTTLAYCYARAKIKNDKKQYSMLLDYFRQLDEKDFFIEPTHVICFSLPIKESISRRSMFSKINEYHYWFNFKFLDFFSKFYSKKNLAKFKIPKIIFINASRLNETDLIKRVIRIICA
ncbi:hypothetical protein L6274_01725 [Candidatus Parcubacteria bacterium]|nr:hypothetical protein [Patescibacteria group bacterium]MCG2699751.1 hypothetical protein [Candidatus Parcubacteria bacterium]